MRVTVRQELPTDYRAVEELTREAFWNLYAPGAIEHYLLPSIRGHADYRPELSMVLELDGEIIGSIIFTESKVVGEDGVKHKTLTFGPVCIAPEYHRQGFGRQLIEYAIAQAHKTDYPAIIIAGFPHHYQPYGFIGAKKYTIAMPDGNYYTGIMALPLYEGALDIISGTIFFSESMEPNMAGLEAFDATFPPKERVVLPQHAAFAVAAMELDTNVYK